MGNDMTAACPRHPVDGQIKQMIEELFNISFEEWEGRLTEEEKNQYIPSDIQKNKLIGPKKASIKKYFRENVWPSRAKDILNKTDISKS